jgi:hypothetical protein
MHPRAKSNTSRATVVFVIALAVSGCKTGPTPTPEPNGKRLSDSEIAAHLAEADRLNREPRTVEAIVASLALAEKAFTDIDEAGAGWRASRACAWLATYHAEKSARQQYAEQGVQLGELTLSTPEPSAEAYLYQALNLGLLSEITNSGLFRIKLMKEHALRVIELDERLDYAGGHRFLAILCYRTSSIPLFAAGSAEDARTHLTQALELFPRHGENLLAMAEFHLWERKPELARAYLERLEASQAPVDLSAEHQEWKRKGRELASTLDRL